MTTATTTIIELRARRALRIDLRELRIDLCQESERHPGLLYVLASRPLPRAWAPFIDVPEASAA